jgi:soluble lytic murein transglycosylase-like protein
MVVCSIVMVGLGNFSPVEAKSKVHAPVGFPVVDPIEEAYQVQAYQMAVLYAALDEIRIIAEYVQAVEAEQARQAELARQQEIARTTPVRNVSPASTQVSGACGGATNGADQFIGHESGGNPNIYNTGGSGAWGCYQIMPATWASSCSDLGQHGSASPQAQAQCASRLPLSAWSG